MICSRLVLNFILIIQEMEGGIMGVRIPQNRTELQINTAHNNKKKNANRNEITRTFLNTTNRLVL